MFRITLLFFLGIPTLVFAFLIVYWYRKSQHEKMQKEQLLANSIKGFGVVVDKKSTKPNMDTQYGIRKVTIRKVTITYTADHQRQGKKDTLNSIEKTQTESELDNTHKLYRHTYQVDDSEYNYLKVGQEVPIIYQQNKPENVQVLNEDGTVRPSFTYVLPYIFSFIALLFLFLFLQYLITGETILESFF